MGLGRRDFLRLVSLALVGTTMDPLESLKIHDDYYINKKLGLLFEKPADWGYISVADFGKLKEKQVLGNDTIDKEELYHFQALAFHLVFRNQQLKYNPSQ